MSETAKTIKLLRERMNFLLDRLDQKDWDMVHATAVEMQKINNELR